MTDEIYMAAYGIKEGDRRTVNTSSGFTEVWEFQAPGEWILISTTEEYQEDCPCDTAN